MESDSWTQLEQDIGDVFEEWVDQVLLYPFRHPWVKWLIMKWFKDW